MTSHTMTAFLTLGPPKCGKSKAIEEELSRYYQKLYFGTLWVDETTAPTIRLHSDRRDNSWRLLESTGIPRLDMILLSQTLDRMPGPAACLIDGLLNWCIHGSFLRGNMVVTAQDISVCLTDCMLAHREVAWHLVDVSPASLSEVHKPPLRTVSKLILGQLQEKISDLQIHFWKGTDDVDLSSPLG